MPEQFIDRPYLVFQTFDVPLGQYRFGQSVEIKNPHADFVLMGVTAVQSGAGVARVLLRDAGGRALASDPVYVPALGTALGGGAIPLDTDSGIVYPPNSSIQTDGQEVGGAAAVTVLLCYWGFLRARGAQCE